MKNHTPVISVIIPVYNVEKYLRRCLDSVLNQSFHDIEVICIDDGSTDSSLSILREYAAKDARVRVLAQSNRGVSAARNAGLDVAKGTWISFVDSDDEILPEAYVRILEHCENEDFIYFGAEEVRVYNGVQSPVCSDYFEVNESGVKELSEDSIIQLSMTVWDKFYRRSKLEACTLRFPEGVRFEDNVFVLNFAGLHRKCRFIPQKFYRYFRHEGSFTEGIKLRKETIALDYIRILDPIYKFWKKYDLLPGHQVTFERICFDRLREAVDICQQWEIVGLVYELAASLRRWEFQPECKTLSAIKEGRMSIRLGMFMGKDITMLKPLRGLQKVLYIGNSRGKKVLCIFGIKLASWNK